MAVLMGISARAAAQLRPVSLWPQRRHFLVWLGTYVALMFSLRRDMGLVDHVLVIVVYLCCLPIISKATTPRIIACLSGTAIGLVFGMQAIDMAFDISIVRNQTGLDESMDPKKLAFFYYHTVINAAHVNAVLLFIILIGLLGPMIALERNIPEMRRHWVKLGVLNCVGCSAYLATVFPRYQMIRVAAAYDPALFYDWEKVVAARLVLFATSFASLPLFYWFQGVHVQKLKLAE